MKKAKTRQQPSVKHSRYCQKHFSSKHHQAQAQAYLDKLRIANIMVENNCSALKALGIAHERISDTVPLCGPEMQHENHRVRILTRIVEEESWAQPALINRVTNPMDYNTFYTMLMASLTQLSSANTIATAAAPQTSTEQFGTLGHLTPPARDHTNSAMSSFDTFYGGTFANKPRRRMDRRDRGTHMNRQSFRHGRSRKQKRTAHELAALKARTKCMLCDQVGHWRQECPNRKRTASEAIKARVLEQGNDEKALARVLLIVAQETICTTSTAQNSPTQRTSLTLRNTRLALSSSITCWQEKMSRRMRSKSRQCF